MKRFFIPLLVCLTIATATTSCKEDETTVTVETAYVTLKIGDSTASSSSVDNEAGASVVVTIITNQDASTIVVSSADGLDEWCDIELNSKVVTITTLSENMDTEADRVGTLTVTVGDASVATADFTITQAERFGPALVEGEDPDIPVPGDLETYSYSATGKKYYPVDTKYSSGTGNSPSYTSAKARLVPYLDGFTPDYAAENYQSTTNDFGSSTTLTKQEATGRFYTKKIGDRWWIVDPEGYLHHHRAVNSVSVRDEEGQQNAWAARYTSVSEWLTDARDQFHDLGFHGTGAFGSDYYAEYIAFNATTDKPLTIAPSMGFLSAFRNTDKTNYDYPDSDSNNKTALALYEDWPAFCMDYVPTALAAYKGDPNVLGFFSDNELNFSSSSTPLLERFLDIVDQTNIAYITAKEFMEANGKTASSSAVTDALNSEFCGIVAEAYYKAIREAVDAFDPGMMYLGSRLHGTPKHTQGVIEAAGKYCDIISINYYSRWDPDYPATWYTWTDAPFLVTEFYTKGASGSIAYGGGELPNTDGAGFTVPTQKERGYAYQHFTLALLEAKNCVGWHWFRYTDDEESNKGIFDYKFDQYEDLSSYMRRLNYNTYNLIEYFDNQNLANNKGIYFLASL